MDNSRGVSGPHVIMGLLIVSFFSLMASVSYLQGAVSLDVSSKSFSNGGPIPDKYADTEHGQNISPRIAWERGPWGTTTYVLVCFDPDGPPGGRVHWVVYNIPRNVIELPEGAGKGGSLEVVGVPGARHAYNHWRRLGYIGPQEDSPGVNRQYRFTVYALNSSLSFDQEKVELDRFMRELRAALKDGRVIAQGELFGTHYYPRPMKMVFG